MILLTGATGLLGSFIAQSLVQKGYKVTAFRRAGSNLSMLKDISNKITWLEGDICDPTFLLESVRNFETIIHAAALVSYLPRDRKKIYKINVEGTANLINAAIENQIPNFLHISSIAALGRPRDTTLITEDIPFTESSSVTNYSRSKYLAELEVFRGSEEGLNVCIVNPSIILGPGDWSKGSSQLFRYVFEEGTYYSSGKMNFIDVRDVSDIVLQLIPMIQKLNGERYILNAGEITYQNFFAEIAKKFAVKKPHREAGPFLKSVAWRIEAIKSIFTGKDPLITRETAMVGKFPYFYDNTRISQLLGYKFRTIEESLSWTCDELKSRYIAEGELK